MKEREKETKEGEETKNKKERRRWARRNEVRGEIDE